MKCDETALTAVASDQIKILWQYSERNGKDGILRWFSCHVPCLLKVSTDV